MTSIVPRVYLDASVLKFSASTFDRLFAKKVVGPWGDGLGEVTVHELRTINRNDRIKHSDLRREVEVLPTLAALQEAGKVVYAVNLETILETWNLPGMMGCKTGMFYRAQIENVTPPLKYSRLVVGGLPGLGLPEDMQFDFLSSVTHKRFLEIQRLTGAYQGDKPRNRNQLIDAFHLWCAEHARCDFFLTLDFKLIRVVRGRLPVRLVKPSELLIAVAHA